MKHLGLAFLAGLASATGFAPLGLWPLTVLAFTMLAWLLEEAPSLRSALARGWWFGMGQFVLGLNWIATAFTYQAAMPAWLGWVAVVACRSTSPSSPPPPPASPGAGAKSAARASS